MACLSLMPLASQGTVAHPFCLRSKAGLLATPALLSIPWLAGAASAQAVIDSGSVESAPGTQSPSWNVGGTLTVGNTGLGTLKLATASPRGS